MTTEGINFVRSLDERCTINSAMNRTYACLDSPAYQAFQVFPSTGTLGTVSQINWNVTVPSLDTYIDRCPLIHMGGIISFSGVSSAPGVPLLQMNGVRTAPGVDAGAASLDTLRCDPLNNLFNVFTVQLNGSTNTTNLNLYNRILQRFDRSYEKMQDSSYSPMYPDYSFKYQDLFGMYQNPQGVMGDNQIDPRGAFAGLTLLTNTSTGIADTATVQFDITAPFELSPFSECRKENKLNLARISNFVVQAVIGGRGSSPIGGAFGSMWSHNNDNAASGTLTAGTVSFGTAEILMHFMSPPVGQEIPRTIHYAWVLPTLYEQQVAGTPAGGLAVQNSQTLQLTTIPPRIYVWFDIADYLMDATKTDTTPYTLNSVSLRWDTASNLLADCSPQDLWAMSRKNGCNITWNQWRGAVSPVTGNVTGCGAILCIMPGIDFILPNGQCPGQEGKHTMQIQVNATNISSDATVAGMVQVLVVDEGSMSINGSLVQFSTAMVTEADRVSTLGQEPIVHMPSTTVLGGSFWSDVRNFLGKIARPVFNATKQYLPPLAQQLGDIALTATGRALPGRRRGGAMMTPSQLGMLV